MTATMSDQPRVELLTSLASLYHSQDFSDLVLFAQNGARFAAHRAIVCPRSEFIYRAVREGRWRDGIESHLTLPHDEEIIRLILEYLYLLDYDPVVQPQQRRQQAPGEHKPTSSSTSRHSHSDDTLSVRTTDAGSYGHVYGTSAISAFGGPADLPFSMPFRVRSGTESSSATALTMHAMPSGGSGDLPDFAAYNQSHPQPRARGGKKNGSSKLTSAERNTSNNNNNNHTPSPSPLATKEPHILLHARLYAAASTYLIPGLQALSLSKFRIQLTRHWDSSEFAEAIHEVYSSTSSTTTDKAMREAVVDALGWGRGKLLEKPEIEVAVCEINGLAYELLKRTWRGDGGGE